MPSSSNSFPTSRGNCRRSGQNITPRDRCHLCRLIRSPNSRTSNSRFSISWEWTTRSVTSCCATARQYQQVVRMLEGRGTPLFYEISRELYGSPKDHFAGDVTTLRELGLLLYEILSGIPADQLGAVYPKILSAEEVVNACITASAVIFHDNQVHVKLDDGILSDAAAGADYVKIKRGAMFSEREVDLLEVHEGWSTSAAA